MGIVTVFVMLTFVIPKFSIFFKDLGQELPYMTQVLIAVSSWCRKSIGWVILAISIFLIILKQKMRVERDKKKIDSFILSIPKIGEFIVKYEVARFARALELLLRNGMHILHGLKVAIPVIGNAAIKSDLEDCYKTLEGGRYLSDGLQQSKFFPPFVYQLVSVGEESGRLDETLKEVADWYEKDTTQTIQVATNLLEPAIILLVGSILGLIITAVLMPVFSINAMIQ